MRVTTSLLLLAMLFLTAVPMPSATAEPGDAVSPFLAPLRKHDAAIKAACEPIERLAGWRLPDRDRLRPAGKRLLDATLAFEKTARAFANAKTRRGLGEELDIVSRGCKRLSNAGRILRHVSGVKFPPAELSGWDKALGATMKLAHTWMMVEVTQELIAKGPKALLEARSFEDIQNKAWARMQEELDGFQKRLDHKVRKLDRYFAPLELLEAEGVAGFLRIKARERVRKLAASLVVDLSSHGLVVRIAGEVIYRLVMNVLWPKLREAFRQKGKLELRVPQSLSTLEASRLELNSLGAEGHSMNVPLDQVRRTVARAQGRIEAMRYLGRDVARAKRDDLAQKMAAGVGNLRRSISLTEKRFLLDRLEAIQELEPRVALLGPLARGIRRLLDALEEPDPLGGQRFIVQHQYMVESEMLRKRRNWKPGPYPSAALFAALYVVDVGRRQKALDRHLAAGRDLAEFDEMSSMFVRSYEEPHLLMAQCGGQTRYLYRIKSGRGSTVTYGRGKACGLADGRHRVSLTVFSSEGFQLYFEYTIIVQKGRSALRALRQLPGAEAKVKAAWDRYYGAEDQEVRSSATSQISGSEGKLAEVKLEAGAGTAAEIMRLQAGALKRFLQTHAKRSPTSTWWTRFFKVCREVGDAEAYKLYGKGWAALAPHTAGQPKWRRQVEMKHEQALANLAIGALGDVQAARQHLRKAMQARERGGIHTNRPGWKEEWREYWPRLVQGAASGTADDSR